MVANPDKLHPVEARLREAYARKLEADSDAVPDPEMSRTLRVKAGKVRNALPILDFHRAIMAHNDALAELPGTGDGVVDLRAGHHQARVKLAEDNPYPEELAKPIAAALARGVSIDSIDLGQLAKPAERSNVAKSKGKNKPGRGTVQKSFAVAKAEAQADLDRRCADLAKKIVALRKELDARGR